VGRATLLHQVGRVDVGVVRDKLVHLVVLDLLDGVRGDDFAGEGRNVFVPADVDGEDARVRVTAVLNEDVRDLRVGVVRGVARVAELDGAAAEERDGGGRRLLGDDDVGAKPAGVDAFLNGPYLNALCAEALRGGTVARTRE
jgi:hypothetical protein